MESHNLEVARTARYHALGAAGTSVRELWLVLHGYGQLAAPFLRSFEPLDDGARRIVAPEGLSRFYLREGHGRVGASWMTSEDREVDIGDYVACLDRVFALERALLAEHAGVTVLGFSQGTATACRWVALGVVQPARLVLWAGDVPPDLDLERQRDAFAALELVLVAGSEDELMTAERRGLEEQRLREHGIAFDSLTFEGGHRLDAKLLAELAAR